ncbi:TfuA-like protein [Taklimakanibacter lacteus]|uniref:TfuA-like protein n=1 Tax=Taklimakanibacter lacteus TaxID=2268456 RepID=UPI0034D4816B
MRQGIARIGLIDGLFESAPAVWHKEILSALAAGAAIWGAASMGALRAAELHCFGMTGIGKIFEQYVSGERYADADVAVVHAPAELGHLPLTVALVDVEASLARLSDRGVLDRRDIAALAAAACRLHFKDRTWSRVVHEAERNAGDTDRLLARVSQHAFSQKTLDAEALLAELAKPATETGSADRAEKFRLNRTYFLNALERRT